MAYSLETSSVKTLAPGAEVSGFCDVVARQKIGEVSAEVPKLSSGEGIGLTTVDGKTVITNNISAGENISLVYDQETNTYRIDGEGGIVEGLYVPLSATECSIGSGNSALNDSFSQGETNFANGTSISQGLSNSSKTCSLAQGNYSTAANESLAQGIFNYANSHSFAQGFYSSASNGSLAQGSNYNYADNVSLAQGFWNRADNVSLAQGNKNSATVTSLAQGLYNSAYNGSLAQGHYNSASNFSLAQGKYSSAFSYSLAQGYWNKAISFSLAQGKDNYAEKYSQALGFKVSATNRGMAIGTYNKTTSGAFVIGNGTGEGELSDAFIVNHDGSVSAAGKISANGVELGEGKIYTGIAPIQVNNTTDQISITGDSLSAGPGIDLFSSGGYVVISAIPSNTCCVRFTDTLTSVDLSSYSNYDKVTLVHSNDGAADCELYWDGKTKVFPSGLYCEMVKGTNEQNVVKWSFANSGWINDNWWDWD